MSKIKPCPFCKEIPCGPFTIEWPPHNSYVKCSSNHCELYHKDGGFLLSEWNTRPIEDALQSQIDRLTNERDEARELAKTFAINFISKKHKLPWENKTDEK